MNARSRSRPELPPEAFVYDGQLVFPSARSTAQLRSAGTTFSDCMHRASHQSLATGPAWRLEREHLLQLWALTVPMVRDPEDARLFLNEERAALGMDSIVSLAAHSKEGFDAAVRFLSKAMVNRRFSGSLRRRTG